jgi:hypothetical protein
MPSTNRPVEEEHAMPESRPMPSIDRRRFLGQAAGLSAALAWPGASRAGRAADGQDAPEVTETHIRDYLATLLPKPADVDAWLARKDFPFSKYDPELGYLHVDRDFAEGLDRAVCRYRYGPDDARLVIASAGEPCRINTYGNSFTSCEQVSDGETWQEVLARHLGEPVRNYGIGGYSVYQAYLRMLREERRAPAPYVIFNIFDDDHVRNLLGWQRFKFGVNRKSFNPTVPHVAVDLAAGTIAERRNPCPAAEDVHGLCDLDRAFALFKDDLLLHNRIEWALRKAAGETPPPRDYDDRRLMRHGIFATTQIVERVERFAQAEGKRVLYVLSYGAYTIKQFVETGVRFDQVLVDYLDEAKLPYVDLMAAHAADVGRYQGTADEALARHFIGHYNPQGNVFCAFTIKDALVAALDPKPPAYAPLP